MRSLEQHLDPSVTPKRILSLDGGGIRGVITLQFLEKIETILRKRHGDNPDFRLCHYFDLIGGTSTGAIIAAGLAIGMSVDEIKKKYEEFGQAIFKQPTSFAWLNKAILFFKSLGKGKFSNKPLEDKLQEVFKQIKLDDQTQIKTGLCMVAKRADTVSVWPLNNHPKGKYYEDRHGEKDNGNKHIPLWKIIRACTAAPSYFKPELIDVGDKSGFAAFIDGGVSQHNNPSLLLYLMATLKGYPFHWKSSKNELFILSVGTGTHRKKDTSKLYQRNFFRWADKLADFFMEDASWFNQTIMQLLSDSPTCHHIDSEIGDLNEDKPFGEQFTYIRYNAWLEEPKQDELDIMLKPPLPFKNAQLVDMHEMSNVGAMVDMAKVGKISADFYVKEEHFLPIFDL